MPTERFLYRSLRAQIVTFQKPRNIIPVGRFWAKIGLNKLSQMFIRSGEIPSPGQTSIDKTNDCAMKSEGGALVRGSDPPSGQCSQNGRGYVAGAGQESDTRVSRKQATKKIDPCPMAKNRPIFRFGRRAYDAAGDISPLRPWTHLISSRPSSTFIGPTRSALAVGWL